MNAGDADLKTSFLAVLRDNTLIRTVDTQTEKSNDMVVLEITYLYTKNTETLVINTDGLKRA